MKEINNIVYGIINRLFDCGYCELVIYTSEEESDIDWMNPYESDGEIIASCKFLEQARYDLRTGGSNAKNIKLRNKIKKLFFETLKKHNKVKRLVNLKNHEVITYTDMYFNEEEYNSFDDEFPIATDNYINSDIEYI